MRVILFFDLPVLTKMELRQYTKFRKYLIMQGFIMVQKSVYSKLALNNTASNTIVENLRKNKPKSGIVQILIITEKQYQNIEFLTGESQNEIIDSRERLIFI